MAASNKVKVAVFILQWLPWPGSDQAQGAHSVAISWVSAQNCAHHGEVAHATATGETHTEYTTDK